MAGRNLTSSERRGKLEDWYDEAKVLGIPYAAHLKGLRARATAGAETGDARGISSTSQAGQSVSFFGDADSGVSQSSAVAFLCEAADVARMSSAGNDEDLFKELLRDLGPRVTGSVKTFEGSRLSS